MSKLHLRFEFCVPTVGILERKSRTPPRQDRIWLGLDCHAMILHTVAVSLYTLPLIEKIHLEVALLVSQPFAVSELFVV